MNKRQMACWRVRYYERNLACLTEDGAWHYAYLDNRLEADKLCIILKKEPGRYPTIEKPEQVLL